MNPTDREVAESPKYQGEDERIAYTVDTGDWGGTPTAVDVKIYTYNGIAYTDTTTTNLSGAASVVADVITTPLVIALVAGVTYRLEIRFTSGGNVYEPFMQIVGQR